jgi:hypothetical protein
MLRLTLASLMLAFTMLTGCVTVEYREREP